MPGAPEPPPAAFLEVGAFLGNRYELEELVGEGGSGSVFRAFDRDVEVRVALKVLHEDRAKDTKWVKRLKREVKVAQAIRHPNVCRVFHFDEADGHRFITMEYADGGTLADIVEKRSLLRPIRKAARDSQRVDRLADARAVCAGLAAMHSVGLIHRDITPRNVLRMGDGRLVITDFGLAIRAKDETTFHGGTPKYMAPEVLAGRPADTRADVYQLGILLHVVLWDRHPNLQHVGERLVLKSPVRDAGDAVEVELGALVTECLSQNPAGRPESAVIVAGRLAAAEQARPLTWSARAWRRTRQALKHRAVRWSAVGMVAAAAVVAGAARLSTPTLCKTGRIRAGAVWNEQIEATARAAFLASGRHAAQEAFGLVSGGMKRYLGEWLASQASACRERSEEARDLRLECLEGDLQAVSVLGEFFARVPPDTAIEGPRAVAGLRQVSYCSDVAVLRAGTSTPREGRLRATIADIRREGARAHALADAGNYSGALAIAEPLVLKARETGFCPVIAEAEYMAGYASGAVVEGRFATNKVEGALWTAVSCGHERVVAMAAATLVFAERYDTHGKADVWARMGHAVLQRIGGDPRIEEALRHNESIAAKYAGKYEEAVTNAKAAIALQEQLMGPEDLEVGRTLAELSDALQGAGRLEEALAANDRALKIITRWTGAESLLAAVATNNRGDLLAALGRLEEAERAYEAALVVLQRQLRAGDFRFVYPVGGIGLVRLARQQWDESAGRLQQAIDAIGENDVFFRAKLEFGLARALWEAGGDRRRSRGLAVQAEARYQDGGPGLEAERRRVHAWMAEHQVQETRKRRAGVGGSLRDYRATIR